MKNLLFIILIVFSVNSFAQQRKYSTYYEQRASLFSLLETTPKDIIFLGNSITDGSEWCELFGNRNIKNRGISGDVSEGVLDRIETILKGKPEKIFLLIGVNDLANNIPVDTIVRNIEKIIDRVKSESPETKFYLQSVLPVNAALDKFKGHTSKQAEVKELNQKLKNLAYNKKIKYIDLYSHFVVGDTDNMDLKYTNDGLHLLGNGYIRWRDIILPYINE